MSSQLQLKRIRLRLNEIVWPEERVRSVLEDHEKGVLKQSIRSIGLLHEIIVCRDPSGKWIGVAGYHRWEAMKQLGILEAEVKYFEPCDEKTMLIIQLVENFGRGRGDQYQLLQAIHTLATKYKMRLDDIAMLTGYSVSTLSKFLRVMKQAPPIVLEFIKQGKLTVWHALELLKLPSVADIVEYARLAAQYGWSIKELREAIDKYLEQITVPKPVAEAYPMEAVSMEPPAEGTIAEETIETVPEEPSVELVPSVSTAEAPSVTPAEKPTETPRETAEQEESISEEATEEEPLTQEEAEMYRQLGAEIVQQQVSEIPRCVFCQKPIKGMPLRFWAHKECFRNAYLSVNTIAQILGLSPKTLKPEQILFLHKIVELASRYLEEHPETEKELFGETEENPENTTQTPEKHTENSSVVSS